MKKKIRIAIVSSLMLMVINGSAQEVIALYGDTISNEPGMFPFPEKVRKDSITGEIVTVRNVSEPTLTIYRPEKEKNTGTAIVIAPGGGFSGLAWQTEGTPTAKWCVENGITAFILKYRLVPHPNPKLEQMTRTEREAEFKKYIKLATADGHAAIKYVREHAKEYGISTSKIGFMGYSAGGTITGSVAQTYTEVATRPDFVAPIYAAVSFIIGDGVPDDAPPMFIAWATDDGIANGNPDLYKRWRDAGGSVEMHAFYEGGHGFSVDQHGKASDKWPELLKDWMVNIGQLPN